MIRTFAAALATTTCMVALAAPAAAQTREYNIPAGSLKSALDAYVRQSGRQVIYRADEVRSARSPGVRGQHSPDAALTRLLAGSGFTTKVDGNLVAIVRSGNGVVAETASSLGDANSNDEVIVVTGTNIAGAATASPVQSINRAEIDRSGFASLEQVLAAVPQNFNSLNASGGYGVSNTNPIDQQNNRRATAVDLRGLGPQSTLTLVNGTRRAGAVGGRAVDISVIPLGAIERVEIVTGGKSAIYGSDAVAGVVNLITRRSFGGFESQVQFSGSEHGGERLQASQVAGMDGSNSGFIVAYDFTRQWELNLVDTGAVINPLQYGATAVRRDIQPSGSRHSIIASGDIDLGQIEFYGDLAYNWSNQDYINIADRYPTASRDSFQANDYTAEGWDALGGARVSISDRWNADVSVNFSRVQDERTLTFFSDRGSLVIGPISSESQESTEIFGSSAVVSGPLPVVAGIEAKLAFGAQYREEHFDGEDPGVGTPIRRSRKIRSAFAEMFIPIVEGGGPGLNNLAVSIAARYDDYSDVGSTTNPQFGLIWEPTRGLSLKGAYSTSFRAPSLIEFGASNYAELAYVSDPLAGGAEVPVLIWYLANSNLRPEEAETWTGSLDYRPTWAPGLQVSAAYYNIRYQGRISQPALGVDSILFLQRADRFPDLIDRAPTAQHVEAIANSVPDGVVDTRTFINYPAGTDFLALFPQLIVFDNRTANVAVEAVDGIDLNVRYEHVLGETIVRAGATGSITFNHSRQVTATSPAISLLNEIGKPVDLRIRANLSVERGGLSATLFANYIDGYRNPLSTVRPTMGSSTTIDASLALDGKAVGLKGLNISVSAQNLFGKKPPLMLGNTLGVAYDPANANPSGRIISLRARYTF